jgi:hypothetical protein
METKALFAKRIERIFTEIGPRAWALQVELSFLKLFIFRLL